MAAPNSNVRSKLDRAIVAYLKGKLPKGTNVYPANSSYVKKFPCVVVRAHKGHPDVKFSGNWRFQVQIEVSFPAAVQQGQDNPDLNRISLDALFAETVDALMQSDNDENLQATATEITNAGRGLTDSDMGEFTCLFWGETMLDGGNPKDADGVNPDVFCEIAGFEAVACPRNVD